MDPDWGDYMDKDEDEEENDEYGSFESGRDAILFVVDGSEGMFDEQEDHPFDISIKCVRNTLMNKIIASERDLVGVVFYGTKESKNSSDFPGIYVLQEPDEPDAKQILEVEALMKGKFKDKIGHGKDFSLANVLWICASLFSQCKQKLAFKRILLLTNNEDPHQGDKQLQRGAKTKATDLNELGIEVDVLPLQRPGTKFDILKFYKDIMFLNEDDKIPPPSEKFEELLSRVRAKDHKKRVQARLLFTLGSEVSFSVGLYNLVRPARKPAAVKLAKDDNTELQRMTKTFSKETGEILLPSDLKKYQEYGGTKIYMEFDEFRQAKDFGEPGLVLLGFKPQSVLKQSHHIRPASFLYPDETLVKNSSALFAALLTRCQDKGVVPVCRYIPRANNPPRLVALVPQLEEVDAQGMQVAPPGFHLVFLPFLDDLRKVPLEVVKEEPPREMVDKAKEVIRKLNCRFDPDNFENPVLQKHWRNIEALALDRDQVEEFKDSTVPDYENIEKNAGQLLSEFKEMVYPQGTKRPPGDPSTSKGAKKPRAGDAVVEVDIKAEAQGGRLGKLTVNVLKEFCKQNNIKPGTRKAEIIDAINEFLGIG